VIDLWVHVIGSDWVSTKAGQSIRRRSWILHHLAHARTIIVTSCVDRRVRLTIIKFRSWALLLWWPKLDSIQDQWTSIMLWSCRIRILSTFNLTYVIDQGLHIRLLILSIFTSIIIIFGIAGCWLIVVDICFSSFIDTILFEAIFLDWLASLRHSSLLGWCTNVLSFARHHTSRASVYEWLWFGGLFGSTSAVTLWFEL